MRCAAQEGKEEEEAEGSGQPGDTSPLAGQVCGRTLFWASQQSGDINSLTGTSWEVHRQKASALVGNSDCFVGQIWPASWPQCRPALS